MEGKIYGAIIGVMDDIGAIGKDKTNKQQGFRYRGIDDVMNALQPALIKHKVFVVPEILEQIREEHKTAKGAQLLYSICKIRFRFFSEDGSYIDAVTIGEGMDSGDKASNKAMAIAFKYACFQVFCIPTEEMSDPDQESPDINTGNVTRAMIETIYKQLKRTGVGLKSFLSSYKVEKVEDMSVSDYRDAMIKLTKRPDKELPPPAPEGSIPDSLPEDGDCPFD